MRGFQQDKSLPYCFEHYHSPHLSHFNFCPASKNYIETFFFCLSQFTHSLTFFSFGFFIKVIIFPSYSSTTTTISPMSDRYRPRGPRNQQRGGYQSRSSYIPQRRDNRNRDSYIPSGPKGWQRGITIDLTMTDTNNKRIDLHHQYHMENHHYRYLVERLCNHHPKGQEILMHLE